MDLLNDKQVSQTRHVHKDKKIFENILLKQFKNFVYFTNHEHFLHEIASDLAIEAADFSSVSWVNSFKVQKLCLQYSTCLLIILGRCPRQHCSSY